MWHLKRGLLVGDAPIFLIPLKQTGHPEAVHVHLRPMRFMFRKWPCKRTILNDHIYWSFVLTISHDHLSWPFVMTLCTIRSKSPCSCSIALSYVALSSHQRACFGRLSSQDRRTLVDAMTTRGTTTQGNISFATWEGWNTDFTTRHNHVHISYMWLPFTMTICNDHLIWPFEYTMFNDHFEWPLIMTIYNDHHCKWLFVMTIVMFQYVMSVCM